MVGWVGNAPTLVRWTSALQAARDLYAATNPSMVAGAGIEPARRRLMRPLPSHLAPPRFEKWHGVSVLPRARGVLETLLRKLAPAVLWVSEDGALSRTCTGIA